MREPMHVFKTKKILRLCRMCKISNNINIANYIFIYTYFLICNIFLWNYKKTVVLKLQNVIAQIHVCQHSERINLLIIDGLF